MAAALDRGEDKGESSPEAPADSEVAPVLLLRCDPADVVEGVGGWQGALPKRPRPNAAAAASPRRGISLPAPYLHPDQGGLLNYLHKVSPKTALCHALVHSALVH